MNLPPSQDQHGRRQPADEVDSDPSFERLLAELESVVRELELGELPLAASLHRYEQGVQCLRQCFQTLEAAERRVELLKSISSSGTAQTEPFAETDLSLEEKAAARGRRRSAKPHVATERPVADPDP